MVKSLSESASASEDERSMASQRCGSVIQFCSSFDRGQDKFTEQEVTATDMGRTQVTSDDGANSEPWRAVPPQLLKSRDTPPRATLKAFCKNLASSWQHFQVSEVGGGTETHSTEYQPEKRTTEHETPAKRKRPAMQEYERATKRMRDEHTEMAFKCEKKWNSGRHMDERGWMNCPSARVLDNCANNKRLQGTKPRFEETQESSANPTERQTQDENDYTGAAHAHNEQYREKRRKNNASAKRSREARKTREIQAQKAAAYLHEENAKLRTLVNILKEENLYLREIMVR